MNRLHYFAWCVLALIFVSWSKAFAGPAAWMTIGGEKFLGWSGLESIADGVAALPTKGDAVFQYPQGKRGWYVVGFRQENDNTQDWRPYCGVQLEVCKAQEMPAELQIDLFNPPADLRQEYLPSLHAAVPIGGRAGAWQKITIRWSDFGLNPSLHATLEFIQQMRISGPGLQVRNIRLTRASGIAMEATICGKAVAAGAEADYAVTVFNCTNSPQIVSLRVENVGWQLMPAKVTPAQVPLGAGKSAEVNVMVTVPAEGVPAEGHETQTLIASGGAAPGARVSLITARQIDGPSILHTAAEWEAIRQNVLHYEWAKKDQAQVVRDADKWSVPPASVPPNNWSAAERHAFVFPNANFPEVQNAAVAWQLTRDKKYAEKVATFLRELSDEKTGYPSTFAGTNLGSPQEGQNFQSVAIAYDAIRDAGILTDADRQQIDHTFRLFMETYEPDLTVGNVGNWNTAASTACLMCALSIGDLTAAERYITGPCGFDDYVSKGIMDDGWWWECSTSYNMWVASELTQSALACRPWGIDLLNLAVPASYSPDTIIAPWGLDPSYGISFQKWGPNTRSTHTVKQLWDAVVQAADYRGVVFGMNDGHGEQIGGSRLELAYYAFHDPAYATFIKLADQRDLLYAVPELRGDPDQPYTRSGYAENIGYALLRSQTPGRPISQQIQAVLKIGTQGGFHGHFDRVSLDNLTRYGRDFWCPESIWWGYGNFMYKFYVQTSINHNMVVVDEKQQEAVPSTQPLFYSGKKMQVAVQQTIAHWSDPPYGGMQYFPGDTLADQMRTTKQSFPLVADRKYGELGPYTEPVLQRRMAVVTDDYVLIADYVKGDRPHTFENLFQMRGFTGLDAPGKKLLRHDAQWNPDPHRAAQFVTNCDWYSASSPAVGHFTARFGGPDDRADRDLNESGVLNVDVHMLWPAKQELMLATPAEPDAASQWVTYSVQGDGKQLAHGESGMWILGAADVDVPVSNVKQLALIVSSVGGKKKALFWTNARFVTAGGKESPITAAGAESNADQPTAPGRDYYGGPITIAGRPGADALPTQPKDEKLPAVLHLLVPAGAVRFQATLGADYPQGDESQRRTIFASRVQGTDAIFLTIMEPY
ncbi:MAG TPA: hypothetical protein VHY37_07500, partial [Tepidisphaeraceae bacterium]|nr:hypothetical protein [Tepidisphaeraceae bacterium]